MNLPIQFLNEMKAIVPNYDDFLHSYNMPSVKAFKVGSKICEQKLLAAMGNHEKISFAEQCYYLSEGERWGTHPFHHAGLMYIQEPSAMAAVNAFEYRGLALDMCAAPGGKTVHLASKVDYLVSNEINPSRAAVLKSNVERMGLKNVTVTNHSPHELEALGEIFDVVLVDAPCSGEGMFRKDEGAIREWSIEHSVSCATRQSAILNSADKVLVNGGMLIYSTCTFSPRENEEVVNKFLSEHEYELIEPSEEVCKQTVYLTDRRMRRFYPHTGRGEGQFFAAMIKKTGGKAQLPPPVKYAKDKNVSAMLSQTIGRELPFCEHDGIFYAPALPFVLPLKKVVSGGVRICNKDGKLIKPCHYFFSAFGNEMPGYEASADELKKYLHGEELSGNHVGYGAITVLGAGLGGFKGVDGRYKNLYPKGLRI